VSWCVIVSGSRTGSSSGLSGIVKSDKAVILAEGDGGTEDFGLSPGGWGEVGDGGVDVRDCSPKLWRPRDVTTGVAT